MTDDAVAFLDALTAATNARDLEALVECFTADYRNETPAHPARGFTGRDQVRGNWQQIFAFVPDLRAQVLAFASADDTVWSEWEMVGTRRDGSAHCMRGVIIFALAGRRAARARFYLEPVDAATADISSTVNAQVHADTSA